MLILEIVGTYLVWRNGWGPWALIPIVGAVIAGPILAAQAGGITPIVYLGDVACVLALGVMYALGTRFQKAATATSPAATAPSATISAPPASESEPRQAA